MLAALPRCPAAVRCGLIVTVSTLLSGCLSARYRSAAKDTPPPVALNAAGAEHDVNARVESIVIFHGPGSWKGNAYWDEYIVVFDNRGAEPVTLTSASLVGLAGRTVVPGKDPWELEKESRAAAKADFWLPPGSGPQVGAGITAVGVSIGAGAALGAAASGGFISTTAGAWIGGAMFATAALPIAGGATIYRNVSNRHDIEREFNRRRLQFPIALAPGQQRRGSLFFVITPGPRELRIGYALSGTSRNVLIDLTPAGPLHLLRQPAPANTTPVAAVQ